MWNRSALVEVLCCNFRSGVLLQRLTDLRGAEKSHTRLKSRHHSRNVLQSHIYGWPDSFVNCLTHWLLGQIKRILNPGRAEAAIGRNLPDSSGCQPSKEWKPSRKPLQPTLWECHCMIACNPHAAISCVETSTKAFAALWAWLQSTNCDLRCYPWVSNALIEVSEVLLWAVKISALPSLDPPQLSNIKYN